MVRVKVVAAVVLAGLCSSPVASGDDSLLEEAHFVFPDSGAVPQGTMVSVMTRVSPAGDPKWIGLLDKSWDGHVRGTVDHRMTQAASANLASFALAMDEEGPYTWDFVPLPERGLGAIRAEYQVSADAPAADLNQVTFASEALQTFAVRDLDGAWWGQLAVDGATVSDEDVLIVVRRSGLWVGALMYGDQESAATPWFPIVGPEAFPVCVDLHARGPTGDEVFLRTECAEPETRELSGGGCSSVPDAPWYLAAGLAALLLVRRREPLSRESS